MTAKKLPQVGDRIEVYEILGVTWPGKQNGVPLTGVVTFVNRNSRNEYSEFAFLPDLPDLSENHSKESAAEYRPDLGWEVYNNVKWKHVQYVINELELL